MNNSQLNIAMIKNAIKFLKSCTNEKDMVWSFGFKNWSPNTSEDIGNRINVNELMFDEALSLFNTRTSDVDMDRAIIDLSTHAGGIRLKVTKITDNGIWSTIEVSIDY
jgi:hypothetical protein